MAQSMGKRNASLLRLVEDRALSKKEEENQKKQLETPVPYLSNDCIWSVLIRLPHDCIQSSRLVCKPWHIITKSPVFIDAHLRRSESVLIFLTSILKERSNSNSMTLIPEECTNNFSVEDSFLQSKPVSIFREPIETTSKYRMRFMEFDDGRFKIGEYKVTCLGKIRATCNGLILLDNKLKKGGLIVMNPATRKLTALPLGTIYPPHKESYGFAVSNATGEYKVVHLFRDELGFISCETLNLRTRFWREVDGPSFGLFQWFGYSPILAIGALHWIPQIDHSEYIVSMDVESDKFQKLLLPKSCRMYDRIIEMDGFLCFVAHEELNIDIWILKGLHGEVWAKQHCITKGCILDMVPIFSLRIKGDIIFKRHEDGSLYAYDFNIQVMRKIEMEMGCSLSPLSCLPHVNSLVSWK